MDDVDVIDGAGATRPGIPIVLVVVMASMLAGCPDGGGTLKQRARKRLGIEQVERERGEATPTGRGVVMGHVEGMAGDYLPSSGTSNDRLCLRPMSGPSLVNAHARMTGGLIYGRGGIAPGVREVHCMTINDFLGEGFLRSQHRVAFRHPTAQPTTMQRGIQLAALQQPVLPRVATVKVFTNAWISDGGLESIEATQRIDYAIERQGVIVIGGMNNGVDSAVPVLTASAYNGIAVGSWAGQSSGGFTRVETPGRCKPDIVAPGMTTSASTSVAAGVAARLIEAGEGLQIEGGTRPEVIKAVLLTGASKPKGWRPAEGKPLHEHVGAGRIRFDRSLAIIEQPYAMGAKERGLVRSSDWRSLSHAGPSGWHYGMLHRRQTARFRIGVPVDGGRLCVTVTWHRRVEQPQPKLTQVLQRRRGTHSSEDAVLPGSSGWGMNELTMRALRRGPTMVGWPWRVADLDVAVLQPDGPIDRVWGRSVSRIDNVEHVWTGPLPAGVHVIAVHREDSMNEPWSYAVAWHWSPKADDAEETGMSSQ